MRHISAKTTARLRAYQQSCGSNGANLAMACDQRGGLRTLLSLDPAGQKKITVTQLQAILARYLQPLAHRM